MNGVLSVLKVPCRNVFLKNASIHLVTVGNSIFDNYKEVKKCALCSTVRIREIYIYTCIWTSVDAHESRWKRRSPSCPFIRLQQESGFYRTSCFCNDQQRILTTNRCQV